MAVDAVKNFAYSTVASAPSPALSGIHLNVQTGDGTKFPAGTFDATAWPVGQLPTLANSEIMRCTVAGDTFTLTRAQYGTTAQPIAIGYQIAQTVTANLIAEIISFATAANQLPVGSLYINANVATNPASLLGYGTWSAFAGGRTLIGVGTSDAPYTTPGATGGESNHTLIEAEGPQHHHAGSTATSAVSGSTNPSTTTGGGTVTGATTTGGSTGGDTSFNHGHPVLNQGGFAAWNSLGGPIGSLGPPNDLQDGGPSTGGPDTQHGHNFAGLAVNPFNVPNLTIPSLSFSATPTVTLSLATDPTSATVGHNNLQPYIVAYMWVRTA